ncbi:MAG: D-Ala-D-Ala carboxypeptidase family metallohydrolase [Cyanobacteria bacterium J06627_3]
MAIQLTSDRPTKLVREIDQSSNLPPEKVVDVAEGEILDLNWSTTIPDDIATEIDEANYLLLSLKTKTKGYHNWYGFKKHVVVIGNDPKNQPKNENLVLAVANSIPQPDKKKIVTTIPGIRECNLYDPVHRELASNITWKELLHWDEEANHFRCPANEGITTRLIKLAIELQDIRDIWGLPLQINSGYRDPDTNRRVGGAKYSRHCQGDGADIVIKGVPTAQVNATLASRPEFKYRGLASAKRFTHVDLRGYYARWDYGF